MDVQIISPIEIVERTPINGNVDPDKYYHLITLVQENTIKFQLGTKLYNKILTDIDNNTLAGDYLKIVDHYLKPALVNLVVAEYVEIANYNINNAGVFKNSPTDAQIVDKDETTYLSTNLRAKAENFLNLLDDFLCAENIPEYKEAQDNSYDVKPSKNNGIVGGWYF